MESVERASALVYALFAEQGEAIRGQWPTVEWGASRGPRAISSWLHASGVAGEWMRDLVVTVERGQLPGYAVDAVIRDEASGTLQLVAAARVGPDLVCAVAETFARAGLRAWDEEVAGREQSAT